MIDAEHKLEQIRQFVKEHVPEDEHICPNTLLDIINEDYICTNCYDKPATDDFRLCVDCEQTYRKDY